MNGGDPGSRGVNILTLAKDHRTISLGGKNTVHVVPGDVLTILTPGGGGFGAYLHDNQNGKKSEKEEFLDQNNDCVVSKVVYVKSGGSLNQYTLNQESV